MLKKKISLFSAYLNKIKNIKFNKKSRALNHSSVLKSLYTASKARIKKNRKIKNIDGNSRKMFILKIKFKKKVLNNYRLLLSHTKNKKLFLNNFYYVPALKARKRRRRSRRKYKYMRRKRRKSKRLSKKLVLKKSRFKSKNFTFKNYPKFYISNRFF